MTDKIYKVTREVVLIIVAIQGLLLLGRWVFTCLR
jgi:hypothetical protein